MKRGLVIAVVSIAFGSMFQVMGSSASTSNWKVMFEDQYDVFLANWKHLQTFYRGQATTPESPGPYYVVINNDVGKLTSLADSSDKSLNSEIAEFLNDVLVFDDVYGTEYQEGAIEPTLPSDYRLVNKDIEALNLALRNYSGATATSTAPVGLSYSEVVLGQVNLFNQDMRIERKSNLAVATSIVCSYSQADWRVGYAFQCRFFNSKGSLIGRNVCRVTGKTALTLGVPTPVARVPTTSTVTTTLPEKVGTGTGTLTITQVKADFSSGATGIYVSVNELSSFTGYAVCHDSSFSKWEIGLTFNCTVYEQSSGSTDTQVGIVKETLEKYPDYVIDFNGQSETGLAD